MSVNNEPKFWKSIENLEGKELNKNNEFMEGVTDEFDTKNLSGISRRKFLALLAASTAITATACSDYSDRGEIVPYNERPDDLIPGKANYYASTCDGCAQKCGVLVKTREGRPVNIEGNPDHPVSLGKLCAKGQASVYDLYDPSRLREPKLNGKSLSWKASDKFTVDALKKASEEGKTIALISSGVTSPSVKRLISEFKSKYATSKVYTYDAFNEYSRIVAWQKSYGTEEVPMPMFDKAKVIVTLDADILGTEGNVVRFTKDITGNRDVFDVDKFNRLYAVEGNLSLTGTNADYRLRLHPSLNKLFVLALINDVSAKTGNSVPATLKGYSKKSLSNVDSKKYDKLVADLVANSGKSLVYAGRDCDVETHILVNYLNEILAADNLYSKELVYASHVKYDGCVKEFITDANSGNVSFVVNLDVNPAYDNADAKAYKSALTKVAVKVAHSYRDDETTALCDLILPSSHYMESWGDDDTYKNVLGLTQPVINTIFDSRQKELSLLSWLREGKIKDNSYQEFVKDTFTKNTYKKLNTLVSAKQVWFAGLHDGLVKVKKSDSKKLSFDTSSLKTGKIQTKTSMNIQVKESYYAGNGKFANNGWLQETPHPVSKVTWDNYAALSPSFAKSLNVTKDDVVKVSDGKNDAELPVIVQPGLAEDLVVIEAGYGRTKTGDVANDVGFDAYPFHGSNAKVTVSKTGKTHPLASTQEHHALDDDFVKDFHKIRDIIQEGTVDQYKKDHHFLHHHKHELKSIHEEHEYTGNKWAMSIDLNKCTSCGVCVSSCNVENNVPVVGKDQVLKGREMQWMRLDRYYSGTPDEPEVSHQPMLCQHCDNAPCENVCPVNATNHSPDGLNQMAYNRCVGTRYCANNCPFKVRRFNFFDFRDHFESAHYDNELAALVHNPEVTVRSRGVMEKCTFCIQKIMDARSEAIKEKRELKTDEVKTACQTACPADAIVFGDANDPESEISKYRKHELGYHVLEIINVKPNVTYIAKLRNTHPEDK